MTVRSKLNTTFLLIIGGFLLVVGGLILSSQRARALMELGTMTNQALAATFRLTDNTKELIVTIAPLPPHIVNWERAADEFERLLVEVEQHPGTRLVTEDLREQISRVRTLWQRMQPDRETSQIALHALVEDPSIAEFRRLGLTSMLDWTTREGLSDLRERIVDLIDTLRRFDIAGKDLIAANLESFAEEAQEQTTTIVARGFVTVSIVAVLITVASLIFSLRFSRRMTNRISSMHSVMVRD